MVKMKKVSQWKPVHLDAGVISNGIEGLVGIEELTHYELKTEECRRGKVVQSISNYGKVKSNRAKKKTKRENVGTSKKRKRLETVDESGSAVEDARKSEHRKKRKTKAGVKCAGEAEEQSAGAGADTTATSGREGEHQMNLGVPRGMEAWNGLNVPYPVLRALLKQGFTKPTKIQALSLPAAIFGRRDILGAAETGSGKTLAFGIPIIYGILIQKSKESGNAAPTQDEDALGNSRVGAANKDVDAGSDAGPSGESETESLVEGSGSCVKVVDKLSAEQFAASAAQLPTTRKLYALVLTPTRELAIQVKNHLVAATKDTGIQVAVVVGGMAMQKQERVLKKGPEIVVATPGRLWELIQDGNPHLQQVDDIRYLAIDETDRMLEKGHFQELQQLLERLNTDPEKMRRRQNFVFSATLTLVHEPPRHVRKKGGKKPTRITPGQKLGTLIQTLGITNPKVVDVTNQTGTAELLSEACIHCDLEEKDIYLYYFLQKHAGRTLVFCNSIGCVRRLAHLMGLLGCRPLPLHANMIQRQRLKNLDRFRSSADGLLLATDVAARGLDIPGVEHVVHYQVPRTSEGYVHRSGRTARAQHAGITILLVEPSEVPHYARLCRTLGRDQQLPQFPIAEGYMAAVKERVVLARDLDRLELSSRRSSAAAGWLQKAAREMDILLDEDDDDAPGRHADDDALEATARHKREVAFKRRQLAALLETPIFPKGFLPGYPSLSGKQQLTLGENALETLSASLGKPRSNRRHKNLTPGLAGPLVHSKKRKKKFTRPKREAVG